MYKHISHQTFQEIFQAEKGYNLSDTHISDEMMQFNHPYLKAAHRIITLEGICIIYRNWEMPFPISMFTKHEQPFLKMQFEIEGHSDFVRKTAIASRDVEILHGKHTLLFLPEVDGTLYYPSSRKVLDIVFSTVYFQKLFAHDLSCLGNLGKAIQENQPALIGNQSRIITNPMSKVIQEILNCPYHGIFKKTYIEAKIIELLNLQIDQFFNDRQTYPLSTIKLHKEDVEKLRQIKDLITANPGANYSLMQLAEIAGVNDFKLKKGFKQLFGNTVFGYINDVRMQQSHALLQKGEHSIASISYLMGFKYPHHFAKAFKKKFGYTPKNVRT
ncbi:helix-turn-helix transcriptional regulator [Olivibacter domesticus]|uniref:AraC-type DNA-binding protein n=1 Tax=Olivibacter domesticus TaxID=407022 RepID=A0A1H7H7W5_OLID1|nr:AraC family transcriptional regulator [Olivibacter domesticus]SEK46533.1 AraC-type DNA-binding protein [Olivibacter domesticus]